MAFWPFEVDLCKQPLLAISSVLTVDKKNSAVWTRTSAAFDPFYQFAFFTLVPSVHQFEVDINLIYSSIFGGLSDPLYRKIVIEIWVKEDGAILKNHFHVYIGRAQAQALSFGNTVRLSSYFKTPKNAYLNDPLFKT